MFATYNQPLPDAELRYNFGYTWQGDVLSRVASRGDGFVLDSFGLANASVVYDKDNWQATLFVNNLFDSYYWTSTDTVADTVFRVPSPPRTYGLALSWTY